MTNYLEQYQVIDTYLPHELLPLVGVHDSWVFSNNWVDLTSIRYFHYKQNSLVCACCGVKGVVFHLEMMRRGLKKYRDPHFNLYGQLNDSQLIMMTIDHIIPKSRGGGNKVSNLQTLCETCNQKKGNKSVSIPNYYGFISSENHHDFLKKVI